MAFIDALVFAGAAWCLYIFAFYRMDKLLERRAQEQQEEQVQVVEMGNVVPVPVSSAAALTAETGVPAEFVRATTSDMDKVDV